MLSLCSQNVLYPSVGTDDNFRRIECPGVAFSNSSGGDLSEIVKIKEIRQCGGSMLTVKHGALECPGPTPPPVLLKHISNFPCFSIANFSLIPAYQCDPGEFTTPSLCNTCSSCCVLKEVSLDPPLPNFHKLVHFDDFFFKTVRLLDTPVVCVRDVDSMRISVPNVVPHSSYCCFSPFLSDTAEAATKEHRTLIEKALDVLQDDCTTCMKHVASINDEWCTHIDYHHTAFDASDSYGNKFHCTVPFISIGDNQRCTIKDIDNICFPLLSSISGNACIGSLVDGCGSKQAQCMDHFVLQTDLLLTSECSAPAPLNMHTVLPTITLLQRTRISVAIARVAVMDDSYTILQDKSKYSIHELLDTSCSLRYIPIKRMPADHAPPLSGLAREILTKSAAGSPIDDEYGNADSENGRLVGFKRAPILSSETDDMRFCSMVLWYGSLSNVDLLQTSVACYGRDIRRSSSVVDVKSPFPHDLTEYGKLLARLQSSASQASIQPSGKPLEHASAPSSGTEWCTRGGRTVSTTCTVPTAMPRDEPTSTVLHSSSSTDLSTAATTFPLCPCPLSSTEQVEVGNMEESNRAHPSTTIPMAMDTSFENVALLTVSEQQNKNSGRHKYAEYTHASGSSVRRGNGIHGASEVKDVTHESDVSAYCPPSDIAKENNNLFQESGNGNVLSSLMELLQPSTCQPVVAPSVNGTRIHPVSQPMADSHLHTSTPSSDQYSTAPVQTRASVMEEHNPVSVTNKIQSPVVVTNTLVNCKTSRWNKELVIVTSDRLFDCKPRLMMELYQKFNIRSVDCPLVPPIDIIVDEHTSICLLDAVQLSTDREYLKLLIRKLTTQVFKFRVIWLVGIYPAGGSVAIVTNELHPITALYQAIVQFPISVNVRFVSATDEAAMISSICSHTADTAAAASPSHLNDGFLANRQDLCKLSSDHTLLVHCEFLQLFSTINLFAAAKLLCMFDLFDLASLDSTTILMAVPQSLRQYVSTMHSQMHTKL